MQALHFSAGSEKKFSDFIGLLGKEKIALISHTDLDGIAAAKIVNEVVDADFIYLINYRDLNDSLIDELKKKKVCHIIFTDFFIKDNSFIKNLEKFARILVIDHHPFLINFNSDKTTFLNVAGNQFLCATYICYVLFSRIKNLEKLDWLVACACIADWQFLDNKEWMDSVFKKYGDNFEYQGKEIRKSGKFWDLQWRLSLAIIYHKDNLKNVFDHIGKDFGDIGKLDAHATEVQKEIDHSLAKFEKEKNEIREGYFFEFLPKFDIGSVLCTLISSKYWNKTIILGCYDKERYYISARRQDEKYDVGKLLPFLVRGFEQSTAGGHKAAAGGSFLLRDRKIFIERLEGFLINDG